MQGIDVLDDFVHATLGIGGVEIVIDAAEQTTVPAAPSYRPYEEALSLTGRPYDKMLGHMHGIVIGGECAQVKNEGRERNIWGLRNGLVTVPLDGEIAVFSRLTWVYNK
jgi:hypothetical protein